MLWHVRINIRPYALNRQEWDPRQNVYTSRAELFLAKRAMVPDSIKQAVIFSQGNFNFFDGVPGRILGPIRAYFAILIILSEVRCF